MLLFAVSYARQRRQFDYLVETKNKMIEPTLAIQALDMHHMYTVGHSIMISCRLLKGTNYCMG